MSDIISSHQHTASVQVLIRLQHSSRVTFAIHDVQHMAANSIIPRVNSLEGTPPNCRKWSNQQDNKSLMSPTLLSKVCAKHQFQSKLPLHLKVTSINVTILIIPTNSLKTLTQLRTEHHTETSSSATQSSPSMATARSTNTPTQSETSTLCLQSPDTEMDCQSSTPWSNHFCGTYIPTDNCYYWSCATQTGMHFDECHG